MVGKAERKESEGAGLCNFFHAKKVKKESHKTFLRL
jgi:hypothetical protein